MPIQLDCPRCKNRLSVPSRKAGDYATCPRCKGRFWVPEVKPAGVAGPAATPPPAPKVATPPVSGQPGGLSLPAGSRLATPASSVQAPDPRVRTAVPSPQSPAARPQPLTPTPPPPAAPPIVAAKKVARLITTQAAQSTWKLAEDGKLPELRLREPGESALKEAGPRGMNPLVLFGLLGLSLVACVVLVLAPTERQSPASLQAKREARRVIQEEYFGVDPLEPYQLRLREADQALVNRDYKQAQKLYRQVLNMLWAERNTPDRTLTGSPVSDRKLEQQIEILLSE